MTDEATTVQSKPTANDRAAIADLVIADVKARDRFGASKYGTRLQADNGRDPLVDAYQEALDLAFYLRQAIEERCSHPRVTRGADVPLVHGSYRSQVCLDCGAFRTHGHNVPPTSSNKWRPAIGYADAIAEIEDR